MLKIKTVQPNIKQKNKLEELHFKGEVSITSAIDYYKRIGIKVAPGASKTEIEHT